MLRTRQYRSGSEVLAGLTAGVLGLISTAAAALALHPDWRASIAVVLAAAGALVLTSSLVPSTPSVRSGRLGDVIEVIALISLVPLLVVAVGLFSQIRGCSLLSTKRALVATHPHPRPPLITPLATGSPRR